MGRTLQLTAPRTDAMEHEGAAPAATTLLEACTTPQRRIVVESLCDAGQLTLDELSQRVAAQQDGASTATVGEDARQRARIGLYHTHLQRLAEAGIVERATDDRTEAVTLSPALDRDRVRELLDLGADEWDALDALLGDERGQHVVAVLADAGEALSLDELTTDVIARERGQTVGSDDEFLASVRIALHHVHLPKLDDAGVLGYDSGSQRVELEWLPDVYEFTMAENADIVVA